MGRINVLSFAVANLIAAGEVVDRPSSVIKELLENSIDAGASQITVEIKNGGVTYMRVSDNGSGIEADDLPIAIKRHATSKIKTSDDLMRILTLGFRGEALAAIASVSDLRIISKPKSASYGAMIEAHGGEIVEYSEQAARDGTTVIVENLFANIPARRKFLKRDATEGSAISTVVEKIALSHPEIAITLISDGTVRFDTPGDGKLESVIYVVMGKQMQNAMIPVDSKINEIGVEGFIGRSDAVRSNRNYMNFFINGRFVKSKLAVAAVEQAYTSYLPPEKFPCCVLNLKIDPSSVDINVHPTKLEVKFTNEKPVFEAIYHSVRTALEENTTRPELRLGGGADIADLPQRMSSEHFRTIAQARPVSEAFVPIVNSRAEEREEQLKYTDLPQSTDKTQAPTVQQSEGVRVTHTPKTDLNELSPSEVLAIYLDQKKPRSEESVPTPTKSVEVPRSEPAEQSTVLPDTKEPKPQASPIPQYRIVGELFNSYLIVEREDKMLIIDKHAAHERIIFEKNREMMRAKEPSSQMLITPIEIMLTSSELSVVVDYLAEFEKLGFKINVKKYSILVSSIPTELASCDVQDTISTMIGRIKDGQGDAKLTRDILFEKALYQASCKAAIKAGREYVEAHTEWIVEQLMRIPDITFCPHGRPVAMELSKARLDRQFERT